MTGQNSILHNYRAELAMLLLPAPPITCLKGQKFHAWFVPRRRYSGISIENIRFLRLSGGMRRAPRCWGINFLKVTLSESVWQLLDAPKKYWCAMIRDTGGFVGLYKYECSLQCYSMPKRPIRCHNYDVTDFTEWLYGSGFFHQLLVRRRL